MTERMLDVIGKHFPLAELPCGEYAKMKVSGMTFRIRRFHAEGLGPVSEMVASGFFGLMKMDTLIINPTEIDLPLYSYDRIFAMGNDTLIVELYDTLVGDYSEDGMISVKKKFASLPERDPGEHWYDSIKLTSSISKKGKKISGQLDEMTLEHFKSYIASSSAPVEDGKSKKDMAAVYVNGLLEKGGPSTDVFKKELGVEKTTKLFREILFGIA